MSAPKNTSAQVVYSALRDAKAGASSSSTGAAIPSFDLYKLAREEELTAYRGLCRVLAMHYGADALSEDDNHNASAQERAATKHQRRLLEDLRDALCISEERGKLELIAAAEDDVVKGVHRSGVLQHRADFFDGVVDVEVVQNMAEGRAADDDHTLFAPPAKVARSEAPAGGYGAGAAASAAGLHTSAASVATSKARAAARKKLLSTVVELGHEAERLTNVLLYSDDRAKERDAKEKLLATREKLLELKEEASLE